MAILTIDSGNSYIKWGLRDNNRWIKKGKVHYLDASLLKNHFIAFPKPIAIIVSHVGKIVIRNELEQTLTSIFSLEPYWIVAQKNGFGISNHYNDPRQLGSDRWAALIAAWEKNNHHACLVVNVGTAMTVDALSDQGEFLGGIIVPGNHLILESLFSGTQLENQKRGCYENFPLNTGDAIQSGVIHCLVGAIERMHNLLSNQLESLEIKCVMSGGGANKLTPYIKLPMLAVDELVLEGLAIIGGSSDN